jgi:uncharacterized membrane protein
MDLRAPIGLLFSIYGIVLVIVGVLKPAESVATSCMGKNLTDNVNLEWGIVYLIFGLVMLFFGVAQMKRDAKAIPQDDAQL